MRAYFEYKKIQSKESFDYAVEKYGKDIGDPDTGTFVLPKDVAEKAIKASDGDLRVLEDLLALERGNLGHSPVLLDINDPKNIRVPSGNEAGAWDDLWVPGEYTKGGIPEAVVDQLAEGTYSVGNVY